MPKLKIEIIIILAISFFYILTLKGGHLWMGDSSMYIMHAANIAEGKKYSDTCYSFNPENPYTGPQSYPPLYPLFLAPVYKSFGLNFTAMKIENVVFFACFLYVLFLFFRLKFNVVYAIIALFIIGLNPRFWAFKEMVYPDFLFCFLIYLFFLLYEKGVRENSVLFAVLSGLCAWAAYAARAPGCLLPAAAFIYEFFGKKDFRRFSVFAISFMALFVLQGFLLGFSSEYSTQLAMSLKSQPETFFYVLKLFFKSFHDFWSFGSPNQFFLNIVSTGIFVFSFVLSCAGLFISIRKGANVLDYFVFLYVFLVAFMGIYDGMRYFFPIVPATLYYMFRVIESVNSEKIKKRVLQVFVFSALSLCFIFYAFYADFGEMKSGFFTREAREMFSYLKGNTLQKDKFVFIKPRTTCLFTGRQSSNYPFFKSDEKFINFFDRTGADYCVAGRVFEKDRKFLYPFLLRHRDKFKEVYSNSDFKVFKVLD